MSSFLLTLEAKKDLEEIHDYIAQDNPSMALSFIISIQDKCQSVASSPEIGRKREELGSELRSFPIKNYIIFYRISNSNIQVIRILHAARDIESIFNE
jgi:toxin ParE1/3/4